MISAFRRYLDTWAARGLFFLMIFAFLIWGVGDVFRLVGTKTWVAKVGDRTIEGAAFQQDLQRQISRFSQSLPDGQEISAAQRRALADQVLGRMVAETVLGQELQRLRVVVPDAALAQAVREVPAFRGTDGQFSRQVFETVLRNNGLSEARFLDIVRADLAQRQLLGAIAAGAAASETETAALFLVQFEQRTADEVSFTTAATATPQAPDEATLRRWYANHPDSYSTPEFRRIKAVVLAPQTLAKEIPITDTELRAAYEQHKADYVKPAKRSAQVITTQDQAQAQALAETWRGGAAWSAMQKAATAAGAAAVALDDATSSEFPDPALAKAVFAAAPDAVTGLIKTDLGWAVAKVTQVTPGSEQSFEQAKDALSAKLLAEKAQDLIYQRANKVDNVLGSGASLDELPSDLGLAGVLGTLNASGMTKDGTPAPIPGPPELRKALIDAAFKAQKGDPPRLTEVQTPSSGGSAYYAVSVEDIMPPGLTPFDTVQQQVTEDWIADARHHAAEQSAAQLLSAIKGGRPIADAAAAAGVTVQRTKPFTRGTPAEDVSPQLQRLLFGAKRGEPVMGETTDGFVVAVVADIIQPDPKADPVGYQRLHDALVRSQANDMVATFAGALRTRTAPQLNQQLFSSIVQP